MNANMRRYMEEDWDDEQDDVRSSRERKANKSQLAQARRQAGKEFGKAIAKMHREKARYEGANRKP
jgi:hypothetical protein